MASSYVDNHVQRRQEASHLSWRRRELARDQLNAAKVVFKESTNKGIVTIETGKGLVVYRLATSSWKSADGMGGRGVSDLLAYMGKSHEL